MILVLNCGSQSIKYKVFNKRLRVLKEKKLSVKNQKAFQKILEAELSKLKEKIGVVGHRVVHGGEKFRKPLVITNSNLKELERYNKLAPLHNPFNILGIKISRKVFPKAKQVAVFDTGFFKDLPEKAYTYALPEWLRKKYGFRRFGFHGTSHEYAAKEGAKKVKKSFNKLRIITCHLGGGSSITAINRGKAVDTSMGFTPLEGLMMMTRCGDIDPGIIIQLCKNSSSKKLDEILNKQSGIKGICNESEMLDLLKRRDRKAKLALDIFVYRIQKYIGAYFAVLGGCDLLVFTGAIGSGSVKIRSMISKLNILKNVKIVVIKTDEELMIAKKIHE